MSADHKRPFLAFVLLTIACLLIVLTGARSEAVRSVLHSGADRVVAGVRLTLDHDARDTVPVAVATTSFDRNDAHRPRASSRTPTSSVASPSAPAPSASPPSAASAPSATSVPRPSATPSVRAHRSPRHVVRAPRSVRDRASAPRQVLPARVERAAEPIRRTSWSKATHGTVAATRPVLTRHAATGMPRGRSVAAHAQAKPHGKAVGHRTHGRTKTHGAHAKSHHQRHGKTKHHHRH